MSLCRLPGARRNCEIVHYCPSDCLLTSSVIRQYFPKSWYLLQEKYKQPSNSYPQLGGDGDTKVIPLIEEGSELSSELRGSFQELEDVDVGY